MEEGGRRKEEGRRLKREICRVEREHSFAWADGFRVGGGGDILLAVVMLGGTLPPLSVSFSYIPHFY